MYSYDQDTRRQIAIDRVEQYKRDAASYPPSSRRRRRAQRMRIMRRIYDPIMNAIRRSPAPSATA